MHGSTAAESDHSDTRTGIMLCMNAATALRSARRSIGISQRSLALASGVPQPNLSEIENGAADVTVDRCNKVLAALGSQLITIPTTAPTIADWAEQITDDLASGDEAAARPVFIRIADSFRALDDVLPVALSAQRPASTGHSGYDAALAGLVAYVLGARSLPIPAWVHEVQPASERFDLATNPAIRDLAERATPREFRNRNVFVPADYFASV